MSTIGGGGTNCTICGKVAYPAETIQYEKKPYHVECFRCSECNAKKTASGMSSYEDKLYCTQCFQKGGFAQKQRNVKWTKKEGGTTTNPLASKFGGGGTKCTICEKTVYPAEQVLFDKKPYHAKCMTCQHVKANDEVCGRKITASGCNGYEGKIYCGQCFKDGGYAQKQRNTKWTPKTGGSTGGSSRFGGGGTKCTVCAKTVYMAEQVNYEKKPYHAGCFKCSVESCKKKLTPSTAAQFAEEGQEPALFCTKCFKEGGYARKQAATHTPGSSSGASNPLASKFGGGGNKCKKCNKTVYDAEAISFEKMQFHPACFKCDTCDKKIEKTSDAEWTKERPDAINCKGCFMELGLNRA